MRSNCGPSFKLADQLEAGLQDVLIKTRRGSSFRCHKVVLASASSILKEGMSETNEEDQIIILDGFSDQDVLDFLDTIYLVKKPLIYPTLLLCLSVQTTLKSKKESKMETSLNEKPNVDIKNRSIVTPEKETKEEKIELNDEIVKQEEDSYEDVDVEFNDWNSGNSKDSDSDFVVSRKLERKRKLKKKTWSTKSKGNKLNADSSVTEEMGEIKVKRKYKKKKPLKNNEERTVSTCIFCGSHVYRLNRHILTMHPEKFGIEYIPAEYHNQPREWPKKCEFCESKLGGKFQYQMHLKKNHRNLASGGCIFCEKCGEGPFPTDHHLKFHMDSHSKEITCTEVDCNAVLYSESSLQEHLLLEHKVIKPRKRTNGPKNFVCGQCGKEFSSKDSLNNHVIKVHDKIPYKHVCHECGKSFIGRMQLENHTALHSEPTVPCPECNKLFHTKGYLLRHVKGKHVPDDRKKYLCSICPRGFNNKDALESHLNWHQGLKPFKCMLCQVDDKGFNSKKALKMHQERNHK